MTMARGRPRVHIIYSPVTKVSSPRRADCLDSLSVSSLGWLASACGLIFCGLIIVIVHEVNNPSCVSTEAAQDKGKGQISPEIEVNMSGTYQLILTHNYAAYLLALEIPQAAAVQIEKMKSENISIIQNELEGTTITTFTPWIKKSINFQFNENFNVEYGEKEGVLKYFCSRPKSNIINCSSINPGKGWRIMFDYIFTESHLINKSYFLSKHIGMTKKYRKL